MEFPPIRPTFNGILSVLSERDPLFRGAGPLLLIILALCWPSDKARAPGPGLRGRVRSGPPQSGPPGRRHARLHIRCRVASLCLVCPPLPFFRPARLTRPPGPRTATSQSPHCPSGSSRHTVRGRHERPLPTSPGSALLHLWMRPDVTRNRADPSTDLGLLRARARLSVAAPRKSDLVLSIWHPNAS